MKTPRILLIALLGVAAGGALVAADKAAAPVSRAEVTFVDPDKFTDVRDSYMGSDKGRDGILDQIKDYIQERAKLYVPEGQKLSIKITDVDLAGDFEPWRGPQLQDIRIVKDIYPPRIALSYALTDATGKVVKEGKRDLRDLAFQMKISINNQDSLRHEKALLDDWLSDDLGRLKK